MASSLLSNALLLAFTTHSSALDFTISGGQIFTPGFVVVDSPQPGTPLGGDMIEVALDVTANGKLPLPPYADNSPSKINNVTMFMYSYDTGKNFTMTNGTATANNASLGNIMLSESGSTVKHVKWTWPDCLVGDGQPTRDSDRGLYNISIRQNFRLNGADHYTIFDLPISVTNSIKSNLLRPSCDSLNNPLLAPEELDNSASRDVPVLFAPGDSTQVQSSGTTNPGQGLGAASSLNWRGEAQWLCLIGLTSAILL